MRWDKSRPPTGAFTLNRDCPQARGLVAWYPMNVGGVLVPDYVSKKHLSLGTPGGMGASFDRAKVRRFASASSQYLRSTSVPFSAYPFSVSAWFNMQDITTQQWIVGGSNESGAFPGAHYYGLLLASGNVRAQQDGRNAGEISGGAVVASTATNAGSWNHGVAVFTASGPTGSTIFHNGSTKVVSAANDAFRFPSGITGTEIGSCVFGTRGNYANGLIGEVCVWAREVTQADAMRLYDPSTKYELWYPLRSKKWIVGAAAAATAPTLSDIKATNITATTVQGTYDYAF